MMVFGFFKKKKQYQLPPLTDAARDKLLPSSLENIHHMPHDEDAGNYHSQDPHQRGSASQSTNEQSSLESLLSGTTLVDERGIEWDLVDVHLVGKPTRNFVAGHGLNYTYSLKMERAIMPVGVVYLSEGFRRDATEDYRIRCMIHMALRGTGISYSVSDRHGRRAGDLDDSDLDDSTSEFFRKLMSNLDDLTSEMGGMELRIYHSAKRYPRDVVKGMFPEKFEE